jgi:transcriptional regulator with XRE-family HTH domain
MGSGFAKRGRTADRKAWWKAPMSEDQDQLIDQHVGRMIRLLRRERGLSQTALAGALNLTFQQVQKYERGFNRVSASKLYQTAAVMGVPVAALFEGLPAPGDGGCAVEAAMRRRLLIARSSEGARLLDAFDRAPAALRRAMLALAEAAA